MKVRLHPQWRFPPIKQSVYCAILRQSCCLLALLAHFISLTQVHMIHVITITIIIIIITITITIIIIIIIIIIMMIMMIIIMNSRGPAVEVQHREFQEGMLVLRVC